MTREAYGFIEFEIYNSTISTVFRQPLTRGARCWPAFRTLRPLRDLEPPFERRVTHDVSAGEKKRSGLGERGE